MRGALEELARGGRFDDSSGIHYGNAVTDAPDDGEVMRDEEHGEAETRSETSKQFEDLRLHGDVKGGGGLVGDEQGRAVDDGHGNHDALALASAELVRVVTRAALGRWDSDFAESLDGAFAGLGAGERLLFPTFAKRRRMWATRMGEYGFGDLISDAHDGIEGGHGLLEDHGHAEAAQVLEFGGAGGGEVAVFKQNLAGEARLGRKESHDGQRGDALAGTGFDDESEGFSGGEGEREFAHGGYGTAWRRELDGEILEIEEHERY